MWSPFSSSDMPKENNEQVLRDQNKSSQRTVNNEAFCKQNVSLIKVIPHPQCVHPGASFKSLPYGIYIVDFWLSCMPPILCLSKWERLFCISYASSITAFWGLLLERGR